MASFCFPLKPYLLCCLRLSILSIYLVYLSCLSILSIYLVYLSCLSILSIYLVYLSCLSILSIYLSLSSIYCETVSKMSSLKLRNRDAKNATLKIWKAKLRDCRRRSSSTAIYSFCTNFYRSAAPPATKKWLQIIRSAAPATQNDCQDRKVTPLSRNEHFRRKILLSKLRKYCACHAEWRSSISSRIKHDVYHIFWQVLNSPRHVKRRE